MVTRTKVAQVVARPPNLIQNGAFDIWQRSLGPLNHGTSPSYATADRWMFELSGGGGFTSERATASPIADITYSVLLSHTSVANGGRSFHKIESSDILPYIGKTMCFSFWIRPNAGSFGLFGLTGFVPVSGVKDSWGADVSAVDTAIFQNDLMLSELPALGVWKRVYISFVVPASAANGLALMFRTNVNTVPANYNVTGAMLTEGSTPPVEFYRQGSSVSDEHNICLRFFRYIQSTTNWMFPVFGRGFSTNEIRWNVGDWTQGMRTGSVIIDATDGTLSIVSAAGAAPGTPPTTMSVTTVDGRWSSTGMTGITSGALYYIMGSGTFRAIADL